MRVLLVNHRYFVSGGPERYLFGVTRLLEAAGHEVVPFSIRYARNDPSPWSAYFAEPVSGADEVLFAEQTWTPAAARRILERSFYAPDVAARLKALVRDARPDAALVLHFLRWMSPSILHALRSERVPTLVRLSDFSLVCPQSHLLRHGRLCTKCVTGSLAWSVLHRCVRGSATASAVNCCALWSTRWSGLLDHVDRFVAPSAVMREQLLASGIDADRVVELTTFVAPTQSDHAEAEPSQIAYVGRLAPEKGLDVLFRAMRLVRGEADLAGVTLHVAGDAARGLPDALRRSADLLGEGVVFEGQLDERGVRAMLSRSAVSAAPSLWPENTPNAILESLACGTPVVASDLGSMREILYGESAGVLTPAGDPRALAGALCRLLRERETREAMSTAARHLAETVYSPQRHLAGLEVLLHDAVARG